MYEYSTSREDNEKTKFRNLDGRSVVAVEVEDETSPPVSNFFFQTSNVTFIATQTVVDTYTVEVTNATGFSIGDRISLFSGETVPSREYYANIISIVGTTFTLDTPLDYAFEVGKPVIRNVINMNVDGSVTPQVFSIFGAGTSPADTTVIHLTRIIFSMTTENVPSYNTFGDLPTLTRGLVLRKRNGINDNFFNIKNNGELANLCFDLDLLEQTKVQGVNGLKARLTFSGKDKHGVVVKLGFGDRLDFVVQDDLTGLTELRVIAQGHFVLF